MPPVLDMLDFVPEESKCILIPHQPHRVLSGRNKTRSRKRTKKESRSRKKKGRDKDSKQTLTDLLINGVGVRGGRRGGGGNGEERGSLT